METREWMLENKGVVYCCTLNEMMMAEKDKNIKNILEKGNLLTADGVPLVWALRKTNKKAERVYGPDLMKAVLESGWKNNVFIGDIKNKDYFSKFGEYVVMPYKEKFEEKDYRKIVRELKDRNKKIVWIGLGAKKQIEMADRLFREIPNNTYVTVGAAFDFLSGNKRQAPKWIRNNGGEWLFRLLEEPERLGKRYLRIGWFLVKIFFQKFLLKNKDQGLIGKH